MRLGLVRGFFSVSDTYFMNFVLGKDLQHMISFAENGLLVSSRQCATLFDVLFYKRVAS